MHLDEADRRRLGRALELALEWHADQFRKGTEIPYASHLLQVAGLVLEHGGDADQAAAGLFHDALEDAKSPEERRDREQVIAREFSGDVLRIVRACTDTEEHEVLGHKAPWRERKTRFLERLPKLAERSLLVVACDKRHNLDALVADVRAFGRGYLDRFKAEPEDQIWYFESVHEAVLGRIPPRLQRELADLLERFRTLARDPDATPPA
jgi:(p)ppGpp synthase/HD superfamily hydrolase